MSFHVLKKRDNNLFSSFWHADAENLPNIPDVSFVNKKLRDHVISVMRKARPVVERQIQELVAIKHVDPWHNIVHEMALPSKIDRNLLRNIIKIPENLDIRLTESLRIVSDWIHLRDAADFSIKPSATEI